MKFYVCLYPGFTFSRRSPPLPGSTTLELIIIFFPIMKRKNAGLTRDPKRALNFTIRSLFYDERNCYH